MSYLDILMTELRTYGLTELFLKSLTRLKNMKQFELEQLLIASIDQFGLVIDTHLFTQKSLIDFYGLTKIDRTQFSTYSCSQRQTIKAEEIEEIKYLSWKIRLKI